MHFIDIHIVSIQNKLGASVEAGHINSDARNQLNCGVSERHTVRTVKAQAAAQTAYSL